MKLNIKHLSIAGALAAAALGMGSCTDQLAFGDSFLSKAPGGTVTADTVFSKAEYTRNFLAGVYSYQYYNLPCRSANDCAQFLNYWKGSCDLLSDCYQTVFSGHLIFTDYYNGMLTSATNSYGNGGVHPYNNSKIWESIRGSYILMDRVDDVPDMSDAEKARIKDEAKCLMVYTYFWAFRFYGGLPLIEFAFKGDESDYQGRKSAQENIDFFVKTLDEVIQAKNLPWVYTGAEAASETGHWTLAGASALKIQILQWAASPLLNSDRPYYDGKYTMEHPEYVWLGGYDASRWNKVREACAEFFQLNSANGGYFKLHQPSEASEAAYRYAFRSSYMYESNNTECIHSVRVSTSANGNDYNFWNLGNQANIRVISSPTQEFVEMFPWADGKNFNWEETEKAGKLDEMFIKGEQVKGVQLLQNVQYTRDPRLYETMAVNGARSTGELNNGNYSGAPWEAYVGGTNAVQQPMTVSEAWATGYRSLKYIGAGAFFQRSNPMWCPILLSDVYLTYAEAILQSGGSVNEALTYVDAVRARVGLGGIAASNPGLNLGDKNVVLEEILRERAIEGAIHCWRYFDMIRYKRADLFEKTLHGLRMYRITDGQRDETQWWNEDYNKYANDPSNPRFYEPNHFEYERFPITTGARIWWTQGFDPKWYMQPLPITEVNKGYGLDQNPGW